MIHGDLRTLFSMAKLLTWDDGRNFRLNSF